MKITALAAAVALLATLGFATLAATRNSSPPDLTAREWGTFTAVVGSDGREIPWWTPTLEGPAALPEFVRPANLLLAGKVGNAATPSLVRMETPVIYFYSDRALDLAVTVDSSRVRLTEVYPSLVAPASSRPGLSEWRIRIAPPQDPVGRHLPPVGERGAHYAHAREVPEASWVTASRPDAAPEVEKFLFYRGVGDLTMPKRVLSIGDEAATMIPGNLPAFFVEVEGSALRWTRVAWTGKEESKPLAIARPSRDTAASTHADSLAEALVSALHAEGLAPAEAASMVATWREAWLGEPGLRLLEILPRDWVDENLALDISPAPTRLERVFVARWEMLAPATERRILETLELTGATEEKVGILQELDLRRFGMAAFERAAAIRDARFRHELRMLVSALNSPPVSANLDPR